VEGYAFEHKGLVCLKDSPKVDGHCPSVTALFGSLAKNYGSSTLAILLTGMGKDGAQGLKAVRDASGHVIAQDEASCIVFGMPKAAIVLGAAKEIQPLQHIAARLKQLVTEREE